jgi:hypothetical protein
MKALKITSPVEGIIIRIFDCANQQTSIPASEAWVFQDKTILASIDKGMTEANNRDLIDKGSFAKYINE